MQTGILRSYPSKLLFTTLQCFLSSIQSFAIAIAFERDPHQWKLGWNIRLLAVVYCVRTKKLSAICLILFLLGPTSSKGKFMTWNLDECKIKMVIGM